jgi:dihydroorotase
MMSLPTAPTWDEVAASVQESKSAPKPPAYFDDVRYALVEEAIRVIEENRELIAGVKVWVNSFIAEGDIEPLRRAKRAADTVELPVMVCTYFAPPSLEQVLPLLGEGDIKTHFYGNFTGLVRENGKILPAAVAARERGVVFDVGHGAGSFDFDVARRALAEGFTPDTISTDIHVECINGPVYDLPTTMAKFMALGMSLQDVIRATTARPAQVLRKQDVIGSLRVGMEADVAVFDLVEGEFDLVDTQGQHVTGTRRLENVLTIKAGRVLE